MAEAPGTSQSKDNQQDDLAGWIVEKVNAWESWRDNNYKERWDEYYRLFRGLWIEADKTRGSERSRIVSPELSQAVETAVAEIEDAIFARDRWIDIIDDTSDQERNDLAGPLDALLDDFDIYGVKGAISEIFLNGAIYGTGIGKVVVERVTDQTIDTSMGLPSMQEKKHYCVKLVPISPRNFVIDPTSRSIADALGAAHVTKIPLSLVNKRIAEGQYKSFVATPYQEQVDDLNALAEISSDMMSSQACKIIEWHGLVPRSMINAKETLFDEIELALNSKESIDSAIIPSPAGSSEEDLIEAIVTIVNDAHVARAVANPFMSKDRSLVAYQHDTVPDRFWGRGICEKGYNPQKALDAEIRARIDALGYSTAPMMGIDSTKIPRGENFAVRPGKNILTIGNPAESLMPLKFPPPDPYTFQQTQELREMIQRGTGSYELPANVDNSRMAATSMSMIVGSMIKRSRRTLQNIERNLLSPFVTKAVWRYMQFDPERFPMKDYKFRVKSATGIMAREFEQGQLVSLLSTVPAESPAFWMLMQGIYENSSIDKREEMIAYCQEMLEKAQNPQPPPPDPKVMLDAERLKKEDEWHKDQMDVEARKLMHRDEEIKAEAERDKGEGRMQTATAVLQYVKSETEQLRAQSEAILNLAKAEAERTKAEVATFNAKLEAMTASMQAATTAKPVVDKANESAVEHEAIKKDIPVEEVPKPEDTLTPMIQELLGLMHKQTQDMASKDSESEGLVKAFSTVPQGKNENSGIMKMLEDLSKKVDGLMQTKSPEPSSIKIDRGPDGLVVGVNGRPVKRDESGRLAGIE